MIRKVHASRLELWTHDIAVPRAKHRAVLAGIAKIHFSKGHGTCKSLEAYHPNVYQPNAYYLKALASEYPISHTSSHAMAVKPAHGSEEPEGRI